MFYIKKLGLLAMMAGVLMGVVATGVPAQEQRDRNYRTEQRRTRHDNDRRQTWRSRSRRHTNRGNHYGQRRNDTWSNRSSRRHHRHTTNDRHRTRDNYGQ